ncbi:TetR family transcriptional regulator [Mycobacterium sp. C31M]
MGRWQPDARGRLEQAALESYLDRGFEQTTVAEIAARAGLTERTFFRHFADKREVLFGGQDDLGAAMTAAIAAMPFDTAPLDAVTAALESTSDFFTDRRDHARRRQTVIAANPGLQERELIKLATLASVMAQALRERGVAAGTAGLLAETGIAVFKVAFERWLAEDADTAFTGHIRQSMADLRSATHR